MYYFLKRHLYLMYSLLCVIYIINLFLGNDRFTFVIALLTIPVLFVSFIAASRLFKVLGLFFVSLGGILFAISGLPISDALIYFTRNIGLIALLSMLPWMNSVVRSGRYDRRINELMKANAKNLGTLYVRSKLTTYTLVSFINLPGLTFSQQILQENLASYEKKFRNSFISQVSLRAFAVALVWSPMEIMVALSVDATGVSYFALMPWLMIFSLTMILIDLMWGRKVYGKHSYHPVFPHPPRTFSNRQIFINIIQLFTALFLFLGLVILFSHLFQLNFILSVTLAIFPFSCVWAFVMKRWKSFLAIGWKTWKMRTNHLQNFVVLFCSLAFFTNSLNATPVLGIIQEPFLQAADSPLIILIFIQFTYLLMSMIGIHPIATISVLAEVVTPLYTIIDPLSIGIVLITGALATATVGTYGVTVTITSMNTKQNPYRITLKNMPYALIYGFIGTLLAYLVLLFR
ncbi:MAG: hypothetical protein LRY73_06585 [Bacillus sp. (in: Bacteria)]|nr:hypothetical protein [Bacillus sp. (in: firmicutes)]